MPAGNSGPPRQRVGPAHLNLLSALRKRVQQDAINPVMLIVEDTSQQAQFIETPLRRLFGDTAEIEIASSVQAMSTLLQRRKFDLIVLDDRMDGNVAAEATMPIIRQSHGDVPVIGVSLLLTRKRRSELHRLGFADVLDKENIDTASLGKAVLSALGYQL